MKRSLFLGALLVLAACGGGGGGTQAESSDHGSSAGAETGALPGNAAVQTRLAHLPAPPIAWTTTMRDVTVEQATAMCPWARENIGADPVEAQCPDGSTTRVGGAGECNAEHSVEQAHQMGAYCPITVGEFVACQIGMREHPCDGGMLGASLPECEAFAACIAASIQAAQSAESAPPSS